MFRKTLVKLTVLNSLVFLLIFVIFTWMLYGYLHIRLFAKIDETLQSQAHGITLLNGKIVPLGHPLFDPRTFILFRTSDERIVTPFPLRTQEFGNVQEIAATIYDGQIETREYEDHVYRIVSIAYMNSDNAFHAGSNSWVQSVIAVSVVDPEVELLQSFLWTMLFGGIISMVCIILAGYLLAKHAMIPIQAAWKKQQQFVSDASHELRSPITGIYNNAELMLRHPERTIEDESHRINTIMKESMRMTRLISNLLTLARADANKAEVQLTCVNVSDMIERVVESFRPMEEIAQTKLSVHIKSGLELLADKERLYQLIVILLDNAFKYTPSGGKVQVSAYQSDKHVIISVQDTGVGITVENVPYIFDRFFRGDKARLRENGGTGLGLAIAQWIVEKHKGKISVESQVGIGTKFTVSLPKLKSR